MPEAYQVDGIWFWKSNDAPVPVDAAAKYQIPVDPEKQEEAVSSYAQEAIKQYCASRRERSAEEIYEMRAAFGAGNKVVDVLSGEVIQL